MNCVIKMIDNKFSEYLAFDWYDNLKRYIVKNYFYQEERFIQTFRYVELNEKNSDVFSMEFSSILRDVGSIFSSTMEEIFKQNNPNKTNQPNISHFRKILLDHVHQISGQLVYVKPLKHTSKYVIFPYSAFKNSNTKPEWWEAYNKVKHGDIHSYELGNLKNTIIALAATFLLLGNLHNRNKSELFDNYGLLSEDEEEKEFKTKILFSND